MSTNGSPPKTTNMAPTGGLFGSQQRPDDNVAASDINGRKTLSKDTQFGQLANQFHPAPPGYSYPPLQPPFPGAPQLQHQALFNMTPSSQPSSGSAEGYPSYGQSWQVYDFPQGGCGGPRMVPHQQLTVLALSFPGSPRVPAAPPGNTPVIHPTSSARTAPGQLPGAPWKPPISLPTKWSQPAAGPRRTDVAGIVDLPPIPDITDDEYDAI